jgi:hypothetical protein
MMMLVIPANTAFAASPGQTPPPPTKDTTVTNERLEKTFQGLKKLLEMEGKQLERVKNFITRLEENLKKAKENGKDMPQLAKSIETNKQKLSAAQAAYGKAGALIKTHAGYDDNGKVTDQEKAISTIKEGRKLLFEVQKELRFPLIAIHRRIIENLRPHFPKK